MTRRCTQEQAWRLIRALGAVDAGRLVGHSLIHHVPHIPAGALTAQAAQTLHDSLYPTTEVTGDSICYVVSSDNTPVAWLTYRAQVTAADGQFSAYQRAHQAKAVEALAQLTRRAVDQLARLRDHRDRRSPGAEPDVRGPGTRVRVADPAEPTLTWWTSLGPDLTAARAHVASLIGTSREALVVDARGYGAYASGAHPLPVPVLCAIEHLAAGHDLPAAVIGDWLYAEGAAHQQADPADILDAFTTSYLGRYPHRQAYASAELDRRGWTQALTNAGIPAHLFDLCRFTGILFDDEVRGIVLPDSRVAVFRRAPG
ncbi:hypothetical protein [Paractinoplanes rishiriensis]|uniref:Uncharacterized protein n=1 Tax=Paractinoplanes rishiriensis TaxID=1050105 RepID=A0A919N1C4_9ACTN|nr:hypothetical protein [Actinoplanes rishiriensis]GIF01091.1 hypothetical protein Ari01nite_85550 [Actinoplanes rishiriensis]